MEPQAPQQQPGQPPGFLANTMSGQQLLQAAQAAASAGVPQQATNLQPLTGLLQPSFQLPSNQLLQLQLQQLLNQQGLQHLLFGQPPNLGLNIPLTLEEFLKVY
jgi:hypothetical protein